jgi:SAM-dependent methyltransferase
MTNLSREEIERRIEELKPWRYNHEHDGIKIAGTPGAMQVHDLYGKAIMQHLVSQIVGDRDPKDFRAIDLGCLEGHYTDVLCEAGLGEVVGIDLSEGHVERARFLLQELKGHRNATVLQGNVADETQMGNLGKFNIVLFHGLLYHLKDPLKMFDIVEQMIPDDGPFYLLLSTQFKGQYGAVILPQPVAELQIKTSTVDLGGEGSYQLQQVDGSVFERCSFRLNPQAVYQTLKLYGYQGMIAYDTPGGYGYSYNVSLVATRNRQPDLLRSLQDGPDIESVRFYEWDGQSVDSYDFNKKLIPRLSRFLMRVILKLLDRVGKFDKKIDRRRRGVFS